MFKKTHPVVLVDSQRDIEILSSMCKVLDISFDNRVRKIGGFGLVTRTESIDNGDFAFCTPTSAMAKAHLEFYHVDMETMLAFLYKFKRTRSFVHINDNYDLCMNRDEQNLTVGCVTINQTKWVEIVEAVSKFMQW